MIARLRARLGALPAGCLVGGLCGAVIGGVGGRVLMRVIFLADTSKDGASTDFGTAGEITLGGSFTLLMLCLVTGTIGGALYVGLRRSLPGSSVTARGASFGLLIAAGPGAIFIGGIDIEIFEPALPIFVAFSALFIGYGVLVARFTDHLHPPRSVLAHSDAEWKMWLARAILVAVVALLVFQAGGALEDAGTCLTGDGTGGCGERA